MSDEEQEVYKRKLGCDLVHVEVEGPDEETVDRQFEETVEMAFEKYAEYVADDGRIP